MLGLAARHRVRPLLYASLAAAESARVPREALDNLRGFVVDNSRRSLFLIGELLRLLDLLESQGTACPPV